MGGQYWTCTGQYSDTKDEERDEHLNRPAKTRNTFLQSIDQMDKWKDCDERAKCPGCHTRILDGLYDYTHGDHVICRTFECLKGLNRPDTQKHGCVCFPPQQRCSMCAVITEGMGEYPKTTDPDSILAKDAWVGLCLNCQEDGKVHKIPYPGRCCICGATGWNKRVWIYCAHPQQRHPDKTLEDPSQRCQRIICGTYWSNRSQMKQHHISDHMHVNMDAANEHSLEAGDHTDSAVRRRSRILGQQDAKYNVHHLAPSLCLAHQLEPPHKNPGEYMEPLEICSSAGTCKAHFRCGTHFQNQCSNTTEHNPRAPLHSRNDCTMMAAAFYTNIGKAPWTDVQYQPT